ncbi:DUF615 domain-containing protein [Kineobactrum sediminis]|uniref:Dual-action ribosomal maturation protein DarP n=1 Tax=Kineobactrum sediminis TaxID=1905677 RepID=A0A2N5Y3D4_9GAMM|nr:ribosome biogenesis factor YjgA [Kineobactrum sediminis]PLW82903.1 DUF615 domain-containing protein [Kineobactrum sediminis]
MPDYTPHHDDLDTDDGPSKSELKRQMTALQALGESLCRLSDKELRQIPIEDERLTEAIAEMHRINSNSARKRHLQFIGKLMRNLDPEPIEAALASLNQAHTDSARRFQELEVLRDQLLERGLPAIEDVVARWPRADRQQLRQLLLQVRREQQREQPPAARRKLFRYLRELDDAASGSGEIMDTGERGNNGD